MGYNSIFTLLHPSAPALQLLTSSGDWLQSSKDPSLHWPAVYLGNMQVNVGERQMCVVDMLCQCLMRMELYLEQLEPLNALNKGMALSPALSGFCLQVWVPLHNRQFHVSCLTDYELLCIFLSFLMNSLTLSHHSAEHWDAIYHGYCFYHFLIAVLSAQI